MWDGAPETEPRHTAQTLQECARKQRNRADHDPGGQVNGAVWKASLDEVPAQEEVQNAGHEELDDLRTVDQAAAVALAPHVFCDPDVAVAHPDVAAVLVQLVEAEDEDLAGVAADVGHHHHRDQSPVSALQNGVRKRDDKHPLLKKHDILDTEG